LYRKTRPREHFLFPHDPTGIALRYELLTEDPDLSLDRLGSACSRNGRVGLATSEVVERLANDGKALFSERAREGYFVELGLDTMLVKAQPKLQGNDASGYKVTLYPSASYKTASYVVKEDGDYKVLATSRFPAAIGLEILDRLTANDLAGARQLLDWLREDQHLAGGDDPLAGEPFPRFWTKGRDADARAMTLAAASILVSSKDTARRGLAILEPAAISSTNDAERLNIALAMLTGYDVLDEFEKALAVCLDLARQYPESDRVFQDGDFDLRALGRFDHADQLAEDRLKRIPGDLLAMRALAYNAEVREDYFKAHALTQKIIDDGKADPDDLNRIAWFSLFTGSVQASDVEDAIRASDLGNKGPHILHTLGCVYAEIGKIKEAREVLVEAMDALNLDEPNDNYWYAFGRIAEQAGERDVALADYARVKKPKRPIEVHDSSYTLAQIRLRAMRASSEK
jgi:tetratricopeptide (TPR) repeat protein